MNFNFASFTSFFHSPSALDCHYPTSCRHDRVTCKTTSRERATLHAVAAVEEAAGGRRWRHRLWYWKAKNIYFFILVFPPVFFSWRRRLLAFALFISVGCNKNFIVMLYAYETSGRRWKRRKRHSKTYMELEIALFFFCRTWYHTLRKRKKKINSEFVCERVLCFGRPPKRYVSCVITCRMRERPENLTRIIS